MGGNLFCSCLSDSFDSDRVSVRSVETQTPSVTPWPLRGEDLTTKRPRPLEEEMIDFPADNTDNTDGIDVVTFMSHQGLIAPDIQSFIARLPRERWKMPCAEEIRGGNICRFCFIEYNPGDVMARLACHHQAHESCVEAFLSRCPKCPICWRSVCNP